MCNAERTLIRSRQTNNTTNIHVQQEWERAKKRGKIKKEKESEFESYRCEDERGASPCWRIHIDRDRAM